MNNQIQALADYTFTSKYAKYNKKLKRRETWDECIDRSFEMHKKKYEYCWNELEPSVMSAFEDYRNKMCLGSQRALQFAGDAVFRHEARQYNCCASYCDRLRFFQEAMYLLLCGTGVGFSVQTHHVDKLPPLDHTPKTTIKTVVIDDSIEGWSDAVGLLVSSYFEKEYSGIFIDFDYSKIRPKGSEFSHGIGKAPGPDGLRNSIEKVRDVLESCIKSARKKLRPIDAYDIVMHSSDAVLSGGIRRCLPGGYLVKMADGSFKPIQTIQIGDMIEFSGSSYPVKNVFDNGYQKLIKITTKDGFHISTPNHRWLAKNKKTNNIEWVEAKNLNQDYSLVAQVNDV